MLSWLSSGVFREMYEAMRKRVAERAEPVPTRLKTHRQRPTVKPMLEELDQRILPSGTPIPFVEGANNTVQVASFTDSDGNTNPGLYSASINWGNGQTTTSNMIGYSNGQFHSGLWTS